MSQDFEKRQDEQAAVQAGNNYVLDLIKNYQERLPGNYSPW
jgi:hypothetical protein